MNAANIDCIAEELGAVHSIIETLKNDVTHNSISDDDKKILLEYANGYVECCFSILTQTSR